MEKVIIPIDPDLHAELRAYCDSCGIRFVDFIGQAKASGYKIILVCMHLFDSSLNEARVKQCVAEGGHNVPTEKSHFRIPRTIKNIKTALSIVDEARIIDNSSRDDPFRQIIVMRDGNYEVKVDPLPTWAREGTFFPPIEMQSLPERATIGVDSSA